MARHPKPRTNLDLYVFYPLIVAAVLAVGGVLWKDHDTITSQEARIGSLELQVAALWTHHKTEYATSKP